MKLKFIILIFIFVLINPLQALPAPAKWARPQCIKTYVPPKHKHTKLMKEAFEKWSKASGNKIKFYYVHTPKIAQIRVEFYELNPYDEWNVGTQDSYIRRTKKLRSHIYIASTTYDGEKLSKDELFGIMLHEIGHCLGLQHTRNKLSIMHPTRNKNQKIAQTDVDRLKMLYNIKTR